MAGSYTRKISSEESRESCIMVLKDKLKYFPPIGEEFTLQDAAGHAAPIAARVESYPCTCRGPELPHEHYFIRFAGLDAGDRIEITDCGDRKYTYRILER